MFAVYGRSGQLFSGAMEAMGQVVPISALARSRHLTYSGTEHPESSQAQSDSVTHHNQPADTLHRDAMAAYAQALNTETARHPLSRVADIMSRKVLSLPDSMTLDQAWEVLTSHGFGQAPVLDAQGQLVGLLMRPDRLPDAHAHLLAWKAMLMQPVDQAMLTPVPAVAPETDIRRLARVLLDTGLPGLPVMEADGHLAGFVSRADILRAVVSDPPLDMWT